MLDLSALAHTMPTVTNTITRASASSRLDLALYQTLIQQGNAGLVSIECQRVSIYFDIGFLDRSTDRFGGSYLSSSKSLCYIF